MQEANCDNQEVEVATRHLQTTVVEAVCAALRGSNRREGVSVVHAFHQEGKRALVCLLSVFTLFSAGRVGRAWVCLLSVFTLRCVSM